MSNRRRGALLEGVLGTALSLAAVVLSMTGGMALPVAFSAVAVFLGARCWRQGYRVLPLFVWLVSSGVAAWWMLFVVDLWRSGELLL